MAPSDYPIDVRATYPERSSRGWAALTILLIKFLALIPHFFVLIFLGIAQFFVALVAQVAVAVSGEYPPGMFDFVTGVLRWGTRVAAFILSLDDRYPPFTLRPVDDYPVDVAGATAGAEQPPLRALHRDRRAALPCRGDHPGRVPHSPGGAHTALLQHYPSNAGTGLLLRQIAALPHFIVLFFVGIAVLVLWVIVQWVILFTARFPRGMFDFVAGFVRWEARVNGYALGLSDRYPPFTFEASLTAPAPPYPSGPPPLAPSGAPPLAPQPSVPLPPAQWYADPTGRHTHRYCARGLSTHNRRQ